MGTQSQLNISATGETQFSGTQTQVVRKSLKRPLMPPPLVTYETAAKTVKPNNGGCDDDDVMGTQSQLNFSATGETQFLGTQTQYSGNDDGGQSNQMESNNECSGRVGSSSSLYINRSHNFYQE